MVQKQINKWLRLIHRDLGFFLVGITLVYAISGIILNHKVESEDPAYDAKSIVKTIPTGLDIEDLKDYWNSNIVDYRLNNVIPDEDNFQVFIKGGLGEYFPQSGVLRFNVYKRNHLIYYINKLHYNHVSGWSVIADIFAAALIFFALSGLFMVKGKRGVKGRGKWYLVLGFVLPIMYIVYFV